MKGYRYAYRLMFNDDYFCVIQIAPYNSGTRFMRLEWNPNSAQRVCPAATERLLAVLLEATSSDPLQLISNARITRIDLTFDLYRVTLDSFLVHSTLRKNYSGQYSQIHDQFGPHGMLNARYIGKADSEQYLLIYDKRLQVEMAQIRKNPHHQINAQHMNGVRRIRASKTRFELRLRKVGSWTRLFNLPNPFEKYTVISYTSASNVSRDHQWQFFVLACQAAGAQAALSKIENQRERKKYVDNLRLGEPPTWWNPEVIRRELPTAIIRALGAEIAR